MEPSALMCPICTPHPSPSLISHLSSVITSQMDHLHPSPCYGVQGKTGDTNPVIVDNIKTREVKCFTPGAVWPLFLAVTTRRGGAPGIQWVGARW